MCSDASNHVRCDLAADAAAVRFTCAVSHLQVDERQRGTTTHRHAEVNTHHANTKQEIGRLTNRCVCVFK